MPPTPSNPLQPPIKPKSAHRWLMCPSFPLWLSVGRSMDFLGDPYDPLSISAAVIGLLLTFYGFRLFLNASFSKRRRKYAPVAGTIFHLFINFRRLNDYLTQLSRKYKTFRSLTPFCDYVFTVDPTNVEYILKTHFTNYGKGEIYYDIFNGFLGDGIFAVDGEKWRHQRKTASYEFSGKVLRDYSSLVFRSKATRLAQIILDAASSNQMIEIQELFMKSTLDSIFKVGFGVELDTICGSNKSGTEFAKAFDDSSSQILQRFFDVFWKTKRLLNIGSEAALKKNLKFIDDFLYKQIDKRIKEMSDRLDNSIEKEDILSRFLAEREKDADSMSDRYLRDIVLNFVIAGRDTTASTLSWFFYMICKHPDVQEKIALEVRNVTGAKYRVSVGEFEEYLTEDSLNGMHYLHAALTETLRIYPALPLDGKLCFSDDKLPDGHDVRKGDLVIYQPYAMGRMEFLWGENAEEFRPERWLTESGIFVPESPFKFTAFQGGPRICLGKEFAYRQMKIFAATLLYFFKFKLWDANKSVIYRTMINLQIEGGLQVSAVERE